MNRTSSFIPILNIFLFSFFTSFTLFGQAENSVKDTIPVITFDQPFFDLGQLDSGVVATFDMGFKNTGSGALLIEVVTACKCTEIQWPREPIMPGDSGVIQVSFDTRGQTLGKIKKTIDIIANTDPIVIEAEMRCELVERGD